MGVSMATAQSDASCLWPPGEVGVPFPAVRVVAASTGGQWSRPARSASLSKLLQLRPAKPTAPTYKDTEGPWGILLTSSALPLCSHLPLETGWGMGLPRGSKNCQEKPQCSAVTTRQILKRLLRNSPSSSCERPSLGNNGEQEG